MKKTKDMEERLVHDRIIGFNTRLDVFAFTRDHWNEYPKRYRDRNIGHLPSYGGTGGFLNSDFEAFKRTTICDELQYFKGEEKKKLVDETLRLYESQKVIIEKHMYQELKEIQESEYWNAEYDTRTPEEIISHQHRDDFLRKNVIDQYVFHNLRIDYYIRVVEKIKNMSEEERTRIISKYPLFDGKTIDQVDLESYRMKTINNPKDLYSHDDLFSRVVFNTINKEAEELYQQKKKELAEKLHRNGS